MLLWPATVGILGPCYLGTGGGSRPIQDTGDHLLASIEERKRGAGVLGAHQILQALCHGLREYGEAFDGATQEEKLCVDRRGSLSFCEAQISNDSTPGIGYA